MKSLLKNKNISDSLKLTREKRLNQTCKVYELKLIENKFNKSQIKFLNQIFVEAKWLYNDILNCKDLKSYDTKSKIVNVLNKNKEIEIREFKVLGSQIKQEILKRTLTSIKSLSTKKKKNLKIGKLKFKSQINSVPLKQYKITYKFINNKLKIQNCKKSFYVKGLQEQIPIEAEFANANLIKKPSGYYLKVTTFITKEIKNIKNKEAIGIDFGIKTDLTLSNGIKINTKFPISNKIKKEQRRLSTKIKNSKNYFKQKNILAKSYEKYCNKKIDAKNKIVSYLKNNYFHIAVQNENIKSWHSGFFGKQVQQSILGGIISELKKLPQTSIVDRYFPSTQLCPKCKTLNKIKLSERIYKCSKCKYQKDRDIHAAKNILNESFLKSKIPAEYREFKPMELNVNTIDYLMSIANVNYEVGRYNSLELC